jgi:hypothetical protein
MTEKEIRDRLEVIEGVQNALAIGLGIGLKYASKDLHCPLLASMPPNRSAGR